MALQILFCSFMRVSVINKLINKQKSIFQTSKLI